MMNQEPAKARKRYKKNKPKRIISAAEKKIFSRQKTDATGRFNQTTGRPKSTYDRSDLDTSRLVKDLKPKKGEVIDEERYKRSPKLKKFDQFVKDAAGKKGQEKIDGMNKATKAHNKLSPEDIK